jgi:hypothetical protein
VHHFENRLELLPMCFARQARRKIVIGFLVNAFGADAVQQAGYKNSGKNIKVRACLLARRALCCSRDPRVLQLETARKMGKLYLEATSSDQIFKRKEGQGQKRKTELAAGELPPKWPQIYI